MKIGIADAGTIGGDAADVLHRHLFGRAKVTPTCPGPASGAPSD